MWKISQRAIPLALITAACAAGDGPGGDGDAGAVERDSAGIAIVENRSGDSPLGAVAVRVAELMTPDSALMALPWGVVADPRAGRIYVADKLAKRVSVFDRNGGYVGSLGGPGAGPGEFRDPAAVALDRDGALAVWDTGRGILSRWSPEGELLAEERTEVSYWGPGFSVAADGVVTVTNAEGGSERVMEQRLVAFGSEGERVLHVVPLEMVMMRLPCATMPAQKVLAPRVIWTSLGDTVYVLNGPEYRIDVFSRGEAVASLRRAVEPIRVTEALAAAAVTRGPGPYASFLRRCGVTAEQLVAAVGYEEEATPVLGIAVDPAGRLWVTRGTDGISLEFVDILGADGRYLGTIEAPGMPIAFLSATRFVALRLTEMGGIALTLYELRGA